MLRGVTEGHILVESLIELATLLDLVQEYLNVHGVVDPVEGGLVVTCEGLNCQVLEVGIEASGTVLVVGDLEEADLESLEETTGPLTAVGQVSGEAGWLGLSKIWEWEIWVGGCTILGQGNA